MNLAYKILLVVFVIVAGINLYAIDYSIGFMNDENSKYLFSFGAAVLGIIVIFLLDTWSKLRPIK